MRTFTRPLACVTFFVLAVLPLVLFTAKGPWLGRNEIRLQRLSPFPDRFTPNVFRNVDHWFADRIGLRLPLMWIGAHLNVGLLQRSTDRRVRIGRDRWLFWTGDSLSTVSMADFRGRLRFSADEVATAERRLIDIRDGLAACGAHGIVVVAPDKQSIYGEYLDDAPVRPKTRLDDLLQRLDPQARAMMLDLRRPLRAAKAANSEMPLYFKTDTHWNELGAFYGYQAIITALAKVMPIANLSLASLDDFTVKIRPFHGGDLASSMLLAPGLFPDIQTVLTRKSARIHTATGRLVMVSDSFSTLLTPYFAPHFADVVKLKASFGDADPKQIVRLHPTAVILEIVERALDNIAYSRFDWPRVCPR